MKENKIDRVIFYSKEDLINQHELEKAEVLLKKNTLNEKLTLNDLIEYYNIHLYFKNNLFGINWNLEEKNKYIKITDTHLNILKKIIANLNDSNLEEEINSIEKNYCGNFWELTNNINNLKGISDNTISRIINQDNQHIRQILFQNKIVLKYDRTISEYLIRNPHLIEIILSEYEEKESVKKRITLPKSLTLIDKENMIISYLESDKANLNFVRLIENSRDSNQIKLSARTRLKAKRKSEELNNEIFEQGNAKSEGIAVTIHKDQAEPLIVKKIGDTTEFFYSEKFLNSITSPLERFLIFKLLFNYVDKTNLIQLVSKSSELDVIEKILMKSKNDYEIGYYFKRKEILSNIQLLLYKHFLEKNDSSIEEIINLSIKNINNYISPNLLTLNLPSSKLSYLEKIRSLAPEFEFLLKQYQLLIDEGEIDLDLIQLGSSQINLSEIKSKNQVKYLYPKKDLTSQLIFIFFSNQSQLNYTKTYKNKFNSFYNLITEIDLKISDLENYQVQTIKALSKDGYLIELENGSIQLGKPKFIFLLGELYENGTINYKNYSSDLRKVMDDMIKDDFLRIGSTLFSQQEISYFNFHLNKKVYTNGYDLRNKYLHGSNSQLEHDHFQDYILLLKLLILTIFKIGDDIENMN